MNTTVTRGPVSSVDIDTRVEANERCDSVDRVSDSWIDDKF
jgi:hypothetical protein